MATNDVNLQVINSMTQDKMDSLKDAEGKILSLANQIIMTDDEEDNEMFLLTHPIGSYYITEESESPVDKYGGGWLKIQGKFLLGADGSTYKIGDADGGEAMHTLTTAEMPVHDHYVSKNRKYSYAANGESNIAYGNGTGTNNDVTGTSGSGLAHNNMPPYHIVNIWKRIS